MKNGVRTTRPAAPWIVLWMLFIITVYGGDYIIPKAPLPW